MKPFVLTLLLAIVTATTSAAQAQLIKNEQTLLDGRLTRAGNTMQSQLTDSELEALCNQGYTTAYFLYAGARARTISCAKGSINYRSQSLSNPAPILQDIAQDIKNQNGRTFVHCNNGAHASGLVAAFALRQFCGYSADQAFNYWSAHLGGYQLQAANMAGIRRRLATFQPSAGLELTADEQTRACR